MGRHPFTAVLATLALALGLLRSTAADDSSPGVAPLPSRLRATGLFVRGSTSEVRPELIAFSPQYPLWSDGASKRRWLELPPGTAIDAADANTWIFPPGTRAFKEFSFDRPIETRVIERLADGSWRYGVYVWNEDGTDAELAPADGVRALGVAAAPGGRYRIPSEYDCRACHEGSEVPLLGFSALQLSPERDPLATHADESSSADLRTLVARGLLRNLPQALLESPPRIAAASPTERAALGYLHGNCGHCHGAPTEAGAAVPVSLRLAHDVTDPSSTLEVLRSVLGASRFQPAHASEPSRIVTPGDATRSVLPLRMRSRDALVQMPPLGTATPDLAALALIERWIDERPSQSDLQEPLP